MANDLYKKTKMNVKSYLIHCKCKIAGKLQIIFIGKANTSEWRPNDDVEFLVFIVLLASEGEVRLKSVDTGCNLYEGKSN